MKTAAELREEAMAELRRMSPEDMKAAARAPRRRPPPVDGLHSLPPLNTSLQQTLAATAGQRRSRRPSVLFVSYRTDA